MTSLPGGSQCSGGLTDARIGPDTDPGTKKMDREAIRGEGPLFFWVWAYERRKKYTL